MANVKHVQIRHGVCGWLAWALWMKRPGNVSRGVTTQCPRLNDIKLDSTDDKSSSLMANVVDIDEDIRITKGGSTSMMTRKVSEETDMLSLSLSLSLSLYIYIYIYITQQRKILNKLFFRYAQIFGPAAFLGWEGWGGRGGGGGG